MSKTLVISDFPCPECGYEHLHYAEDVSLYHSVIGITFDGTVVVSNNYDTGDAWGYNARFFCPGCGSEFNPNDFKHTFLGYNEITFAEDYL